MEQEQKQEKHAFYVVRKGDLIGVYKTLPDSQAQAGSSVSDPTISIFKGYGLPKEAEEFLALHGLKNATYSINAADVRTNLFGEIVVCPFQQPPDKGKSIDKALPPTRSKEVLQSVGLVGSHLHPTFPQRNPMKLESNTEAKVASYHMKLESNTEAKVASSICESCILEFDGASRGNPGPAGSGAVLRAEDGSTVYRLREGLGIATNNVAEYRALILGLKHALRKGFKHIRAQGDSNLVCMQVQGLWKIKSQNLADLCKEAKELKDKFLSFHIKHVYREFNAEADAQANSAINLKDGQVEEDCIKK